MSLFSVTEELKRSLRVVRNVIVSLGGEISATAGLKGVIRAMLNLPIDASIAFFTDDNTDYRKIVPSEAMPYAQILQIGGMTYRVPNDKNYFTSLEIKQDDNGVAVVNSDGSVTVTNPDGGYYEVILEYGISTPPQDKYFTAIGDLTGISYARMTTYTADEYDSDVTLNNYFPEDETIRDYELDFSTSNKVGTFTFKPLLVDHPEDALPVLKDTEVTELVSEGANLIPYPFLYKEPITINGVTWTPNADGSITANGTQEKSYNFDLFNDTQNPILLNGTYTASLRADLASGCTFYLSSRDSLGNVTLIDSTGSKTKDIVNREFNAIRFWINAGTTFDNVTFYPMLNRGSTAAPYKPYRTEAVDTFSISAELRAFLADKGIGRGIKGYPNYIDLERKVFVQNTYRKVFDGTENWSSGQNSDGTYRYAFSFTISAMSAPNDSVGALLCNLYDTVPAYYSSNSREGVSINEAGAYMFLYDKNYNDDKDKWKAHLAELYASGNPLTVEYALAEPIEYDISAYLMDDNFIEVEGGGTLVFKNDTFSAVPSSVKYTIKVGG